MIFLEEETTEEFKAALKDEFKAGITLERLSDYLRDDHGFKSFRAYLATEHAEENLDFWQAVRE